MSENRFQFIKYEKMERIATFIFNRPEKLNAFNLEMIREFKDALLEFEKDQDVRVGIITGAGGKAFSVGWTWFIAPSFCFSLFLKELLPRAAHFVEVFSPT